MKSHESATGWRSVAAAGSLAFMAILNVFDAAAYGFRFYALDLARTGSASEQLLEYSIVAVGCVSLLELLALLVTSILFVVWFHRLYVILGTLPGVERDHHTAWAIWGFIVPIISLFMPPRMASEVAEKSRGSTKAVGYPLILSWWVLFLLGNTAGQFVRILFKEGHAGAEQLGTVFGMVGSAMLIISAVLGIKVVLYLERSLVAALGRAREGGVEPPEAGAAMKASGEVVIE